MRMKQLYKTCFLLLVCIIFWGINGKVFSQWNPNYSIGTVTGKTDFSYNQTPDQLVEITPPLYTTGTALSYQWERSPTPDFAVITFIGTQSSYTFSGPLSETMYYRRKVTDASGNSIYSNIVRIQLVSVNWENINYIREHDLLKPGVTDWKTADQLPIGDKLQTTTYLDGLGRPLQKVSRETATPEQSGGLWGDMVQFSVYDTYGREPKQYLPYTTATELGKYKTSPLTEQPAYYTNRYNESSAFTNVTYYDDPTNRAKQVNDPGYSWDIARNTGNRFTYDQNDASENVRIFRIGYITGDIPFSPGAYPANTLFRTVHLNEENKKVIEYTNKAGQLILTKTRIDDVTAVAHGGYICVYNVYDDFGLLRYRLQPEAVKFLAANGWSFSATNGPQVLKELCFRYEYDDKGRNILKKAPGAKELRMLYDQRDRVVFMQDGNQANKPQWTANLYDELDRPTITSLYNTAKSIAVLQSDIDNSATTTPVSIVNPAAPVAFLEVNNRDITIPRYTAQNSIIFTEGFISAANDEFVGEINATATMSYTVNTTVYKNPISAADLNNPAISTIVKYRFYDDYSYAGAKSFDAGFDNTTAYSNSTAGVIPVAASKRTTSFPTGSMVRVLGTNTFLISTEYYDEKGRHIQTIEDNIKLGRDVTTLQYHWDGRLMSSHTNHTTDKSGYSNFGVLTKNIFDKIGRVTGVQKKFGTNAFKTIASYDFDDMGRLKTKRLDPGYTGSGKNELEALTYSYNIHNNITGINKDYALKTAGKYDKWGNFFGLYLGFDNRDNVFTDKQLDGHVTGLLWNTQGDDAQRKYDYTYDNAGRLNSAIFKEYTPPSGGAGGWDNNKMDFSVSGSSGKITYDHNGNLLSMLQKGVLPGNNTPVTVDNLTYTYTAYSNKLLTVTDNGTLGSANGSLGDFKDARGPYLDHDYEYDDNGNLVIDQNKNPNAPEFRDVNDISYNFLDKPEVLVATKGTINIVYDADGNKLQKTYTPKDGTPAVTTTYINGYIYKGDDLQYINFEEGRIRVIKPVSLNNGYDGLTIAGNITLPVSPSGAGAQPCTITSYATTRKMCA